MNVKRRRDASAAAKSDKFEDLIEKKDRQTSRFYVSREKQRAEEKKLLAKGVSLHEINEAK